METMNRSQQNYLTTNDECESMYKDLYSSMDFHTNYVPPLRKMRADRITSEVMKIIGNHLSDNREAMESNTMCSIHRDILDMFFKADVDIVTEIDRIDAGLPRRNAYGLTKDEMRIREVKLKERMLQPSPLSVTVDIKTKCPKCGVTHNV